MKTLSYFPVPFLFCALAHALCADPGEYRQKRWTLDASVAVFADNSTLGLLQGDGEVADGDAGGEIYNLSLSYLWKEYEWKAGDYVLHPRLELRGGLGIVDENGRSTYMNYSAEVIFRWRDFPWNRYVRTSVGVGTGLQYSEKVPAIDRLRHEGEDRSRLKLTLPLELGLAYPDFPELELVLFNHHFSGAHLFDEGGYDTFGAGLRYRLQW